jgi:hypothetical protein
MSASGATVPAKLSALEEEFNKKVEAGDAKKRISGYSTKGFKFDDSEAGMDRPYYLALSLTLVTSLNLSP